MRLAHRSALVTGSSRGIGAAIARRLAADGARVVLHAREERARVDAVADAIRTAGGIADVVLGDLRDEDVPAQIVGQAAALAGGLDILVCNAGGGGGGLAAGQTPATIARTLALNLVAPILSAIAFARLTTSPHGRVVLISSGMATHPAFGAAVPSASKAGAEAFMRSAAQEWGERGITLNSVAPGTTETDMIAGQAWARKVPGWAALRRIGQPDDIADIVAFLASDEARWITGATIPANGGLVTSAANVIAYG